MSLSSSSAEQDFRGYRPRRLHPFPLWRFATLRRPGKYSLKWAPSLSRIPASWRPDKVQALMKSKRGLGATMGGFEVGLDGFRSRDRDDRASSADFAPDLQLSALGIDLSRAVSGRLAPRSVDAQTVGDASSTNCSALRRAGASAGSVSPRLSGRQSRALRIRPAGLRGCGRRTSSTRARFSRGWPRHDPCASSAISETTHKQPTSSPRASAGSSGSIALTMRN